MRKLVDVRIEVNEVESKLKVGEDGEYYLPDAEAAQSDAVNSDHWLQRQSVVHWIELLIT